MAIPFAHAEKQIDGLADDWPEARPLRFVMENPLLADTGFDNQVNAALEWDEQYLYGIATISDRHLVKLRYGNNNPTLNLGDALEIYIDPLNDSGERMDVNDYQFIIDAGGEYAILKGDRALADSLWQAPKEAGSATIAFHYKTRLGGTLNMEKDSDVYWVLEFALPWAAMGKVAGRDSLLRLDLCVDDMDSIIDLRPIPEGVSIPCFAYGSWSGYPDFGFPSHWRLMRLEGAPDIWQQFSRWLAHWGLLFLAGTGLCFGVVVFLLLRKIDRLRQIPVRADMQEPRQVRLAAVLDGNDSEPRKSGESRFDPLFATLRQLVLERLHDDLRPEDLAAHAHMSLRQLQRIFREELDTRPNTFILLIKMEQAVQLLEKGQDNVSEVAYALGFSDPGYFSKVFKKYFGRSPREFGKPE